MPRGPALERRLLLVILLVGIGLRIAYAWFLPQHDRQYFYDERFALENAHAFVSAGWTKPPNGYYPTLATLPQALLLRMVDGVHRATGDARWAIYERDMPWHWGQRRESIAANFTPLAFRVCRGVQVFYGVTGLWLMFLLGRALWSVGAGLWAAALLAAMPMHVHASSEFKPDGLLATAVLAALLATVAALRHEASLRRYLVAGTAVALALSSKMTGGLTALPLAVASGVAGRRRPRRLVLLAAAGCTSMLLFWLLNPWIGWYLEYLDRLDVEYAEKAAVYGGTRAGVLLRTLALPFTARTLGPIFGSLAVGGFVWLAVRGVRGLRSRDHRRGLLLARVAVLVFPLLYALAYAAKTPHFKAHNLLPTMVVLTACAGWALDTVMRGLRARRAHVPRRVRLVLLLGLVTVVVSTLGSTVRFVYQSVVPTTTSTALWFVGQKVGTHQAQVIYSDPLPEDEHDWQGPPRRPRRMPRVVGVPAVAALGERLTYADGFIARADDRPVGTFARVPANRLRVAPKLFRRRGAALWVEVDPWHPRRGVEAVVLRHEGGGAFVGQRDPAVAPHLPWSMTFWFGVEALGEGSPQVEVDGRAVPLHHVDRFGSGHVYVSERLPASAKQIRVVPHPGSELTPEIAELEVQRWRRPGEPVAVAPRPAPPDAGSQ